MARQINNAAATELLAEIFPLAEADFGANAATTVPEDVQVATERLFESVTQAYREALVGCAVARIMDPEIDITLPATESGDNAYSGRSLAETVVTPFMRTQAIPVSASPYLSSLRGGARFVTGGEPRIQRDKAGFAALVEVVDYLRALPDADARIYLRYLLRRFIQLREKSNIALRQIAKPNMEHLGKVIDGLLHVKSGGRLPSMLAVATYQAISECHELGWDVEFQGINEADAATGAVGDITIKDGDGIVLGIEVTERPVAKSRVIGIFEKKISPNNLDDYLILTTAKPTDEAFEMARNYTAVGHEINFALLPAWIRGNLITLGTRGRQVFQQKMIDLLSQAGTLADIKVAWNTCMDDAFGKEAVDAFDDKEA